MAGRSLVIIFGVGKTDQNSNKDGVRLPSKPPMKFRHLDYFVAAAEELNFIHAADRLNVSQPPFSKQIHDLEGELGIKLFEREQKGVALTPAGKSFLIDAGRILEDCDSSIRKAQRISRGEIGELAAMTHDFLGKALEVWPLNSPGIIVDCIEMDSVSQERALLEGSVSVGILVPSNRPCAGGNGGSRPQPTVVLIDIVKLMEGKFFLGPDSAAVMVVPDERFVHPVSRRLLFRFRFFSIHRGA